MCYKEAGPRLEKVIYHLEGYLPRCLLPSFLASWPPQCEQLSSSDPCSVPASEDYHLNALKAMSQSELLLVYVMVYKVFCPFEEEYEKWGHFCKNN